MVSVRVVAGPERNAQGAATADQRDLNRYGYEKKAARVLERRARLALAWCGRGPLCRGGQCRDSPEAGALYRRKAALWNDQSKEEGQLSQNALAWLGGTPGADVERQNEERRATRGEEDVRDRQWQQDPWTRSPPTFTPPKITTAELSRTARHLSWGRDEDLRLAIGNDDGL